jgi:hypothetical protein
MSEKFVESAILLVILVAVVISVEFGLLNSVFR